MIAEAGSEVTGVPSDAVPVTVAVTTKDPHQYLPV
jgi:hypothetical protein